MAIKSLRHKNLVSLKEKRKTLLRRDNDKSTRNKKTKVNDLYCIEFFDDQS